MKKLLIAFALFFILLIITKDLIATSLALHLARKAFGPAVSIRRVTLSTGTVRFTDCALTYRGAVLSLKSGELRLDWSQFPRPLIAGMTLNTLTLSIKEFEKLRSGIATGIHGQGSVPVYNLLSTKGAEFALRNVSCDVQGIGGVSITGGLDLAVVIGNDLVFSVKDLALKSVTIKGNDFLVKDLSVVKSKAPLYELSIPLITIKEKEIRDFRLPLRLEERRLIILPSEIDFLGAASGVEGELDFANLAQPCLFVRARDISFTRLLGLVADPKALDFAGAFTGSLRACVSAQGISDLRADFTNTAQGFIHLKNDNALDFIRPYVDAASHKALVDNFRNYSYNKSTVTAQAEGGAISVELLFDSPDYGKRNFTVILHTT